MIPCSLDIRTLNSTGFFLFTSSLWRRISFHNGRFWNQSCAKRGTHHSMRFSHGITTAMVGQNPLPFAESMSEIIRFAESNAKKKMMIPNSSWWGFIKIKNPQTCFCLHVSYLKWPRIPQVLWLRAEDSWRFWRSEGGRPVGTGDASQLGCWPPINRWETATESTVGPIISMNCSMIVWINDQSRDFIIHFSHIHKLDVLPPNNWRSMKSIQISRHHIWEILGNRMRYL